MLGKYLESLNSCMYRMVPKIANLSDLLQRENFIENENCRANLNNFGRIISQALGEIKESIMPILGPLSRFSLDPMITSQQNTANNLQEDVFENFSFRTENINRHHKSLIMILIESLGITRDFKINEVLLKLRYQEQSNPLTLSFYIYELKLSEIESMIAGDFNCFKRIGKLMKSKFLDPIENHKLNFIVVAEKFTQHLTTGITIPGQFRHRINDVSTLDSEIYDCLRF